MAATCFKLSEEYRVDKVLGSRSCSTKTTILQRLSVAGKTPIGNVNLLRIKGRIGETDLGRMVKLLNKEKRPFRVQHTVVSYIGGAKVGEGWLLEAGRRKRLGLPL